MKHEGNKKTMISSPNGTQDHATAFYDAAWKKWNAMIRYSPAPRVRREKMINWLANISPKSLLDVGCGNGEFLMEIHRLMPAAKLAGADVSQAIIEANRSNIPFVDFYKIDIDRETLPENFDAVVCMEVIEHCHDYRAAIKMLSAMAEKWLLLTVPCGPVFEIDRRVGHEKHFKSQEIMDALTKEGFRAVKIINWGFPFFNLYKHMINLWPDKMCESFLSEREYSFMQKVLASITYASFKLSVPKWGYQMFVMACR